MALLIALMLLAQGFAVGAAKTDDSARGSLTVVTIDQKSDKPLSGIGIEIFRIAEIASASPADYRLADAFSGSGVELEGGLSTEEQADRAKRLSAYASDKAIAPLKSARTDSAGTVRYADLRVGLYLVRMQAKTGVKNDPFEPFIVSIPMSAANGVDWDYCVVAKPKSDEPSPTVTPKPSDDDDDSIPQTGVDYTGIHLMLGAGTLLVLAGYLCLWMGRGKGNR